MAEGQSMTVADVVAKTMDGRLEDFVREAVALVARELMEGEISAEIGAGFGEVALETRLTRRNGYRPRAWETRVGEIELLVPKKRSGSSYFPSFLEPRRRSEQAIVVGRAGGVRQWGEHAQGRPPRGAAGDRRDDQGPRQRDVPSAWMSGSKRSGSGRWRAPIRTCGWTPRCATRRCWFVWGARPHRRVCRGSPAKLRAA